MLKIGIKDENIAPIAIFFLLGLFFVFVIFPLPDSDIPLSNILDSLAPFGTSSVEFSSATIQTSSSTVSNLTPWLLKQICLMDLLYKICGLEIVDYSQKVSNI